MALKLKGRLRNRLCICGKKVKFKKCCLYSLQGWVKDDTSGLWRLPQESEVSTHV